MTAPARGSSRAARMLLGAFLVAALATFLWGFWVVGGVREKARDTDAALRALAWATLCYRSQVGEWPGSDEALRGTVGALACAAIPDAAKGIPNTRESAMAGLASPPSLDAALRLAHIEYPHDGSAFPCVDARGNPSGIGTLGEVNGWLLAAAGTTDEPPTKQGSETHQ